MNSSKSKVAKVTILSSLVTPRARKTMILRKQKKNTNFLKRIFRNTFFYHRRTLQQCCHEYDKCILRKRTCSYECVYEQLVARFFFVFFFIMLHTTFSERTCFLKEYRISLEKSKRSEFRVKNPRFAGQTVNINPCCYTASSHVPFRNLC